MFEPGQFEVNEAWIVFRLNDAPISTGADGDFNVVCLMDAGSCYMLGNEFVPAHLAGLSESCAERLVEAGRSQAQMLPHRFLLSTALESDHFANLAERFGVEVSRVPDEQLTPLISEARAAFRGYIGGG